MMTDNKNGSKRYWNSRTQQWECGNRESDNYQKAATDQTGKLSIGERIVSRFLFGAPESRSDD